MMKPRLRQMRPQLKRLIQTLEAHADLLPKPLRVGLRKHVLLAVHNLLKEISMAWIAEKSASEFQALRGKTELKVNLGCGSDVRPGFVNIDLDSKLLDLSKRDAPC